MKQNVGIYGTPRGRHVAGFSVVEAMVAVAIIGLSLGAMMTLNGHQLRMVKLSKDNNAATLYQQERVEQLRQARWPDLTSATYLKNEYMNNRPASKAALDQISEAITVSPYPSAVNGGKPLKITQALGGSPVADSTMNGFSLVNERLVKVEMILSWKSADGRRKQRSTSSLISNSGVTRSNLPALGPVAGGPWSPYGDSTGGTGGDTGGTGGGDTSGGGTSGGTGGTGGDTSGGTSGGTTGGTTGGSTGGTSGGSTGGSTGSGSTGGSGGTSGGTTGTSSGKGRGNTGGKGGKK